MLGRKRVLVTGVIIVVFAVVLVGGFFAYKFFAKKMATDKVNTTLNSDAFKKELANGKCSADSISKLDAASQNIDPNVLAKAYEDRGICYVFAKDYKSAANAYQKAVDLYKKAKLPKDANRVQAAIDGIQSMTAAQKAAEQMKNSPGGDGSVGGS